MNKREAYARTIAALQELDAATATSLTDEERRRADATLARILATPHGEEGAPRSSRPKWRARLAVAASSVAVVIATPLALGGGDAFASWSPTPTPLTSAEAEAAAETCRSVFTIPDHPDLPVVLGEKRGGWTYVVLEGSSGAATCLMPDDIVGRTDAEAAREGFSGFYDPDPANPSTPTKPTGLLKSIAGFDAVTLPGRLPGLHRTGYFNWVAGYAGNDVVAVTVHTPTGEDVEASLVDGRWAAWWPVSDAVLAGQGATSYTVTLADGTARPVEPQE